MDAFSGFQYQLDPQGSKMITSTIRCAGLNWLIIQSTLFSLYISVLADTGYQRVFVLFKTPQYIFGITVSFLAAFSSFALCGKECLGLLKFLISPGQV